MTKHHVGEIVKLKIKDVLDDTYLLSNGSSDVHLNKSDLEQSLKIDDQVEVFLYHDDKETVTATAIIPSVQLEAYDWGEVVQVSPKLGAFVNIGIPKDILVMADDLPEHRSVWPIAGDELYVTLKLDYKDRLLAEPVTEDVFEGNWDEAPESLFNENIGGRVFRSGKIGAVMITEEGYRGFIHHTEYENEPRVGEWVEGRVIKVKDDGTLNISLLPRVEEAQAIDAEIILSYLKENDGEIPFDNKSNPDEIRETFNMSKAAFKRGIGKLYKERLIKQEEGKTVLIDQ